MLLCHLVVLAVACGCGTGTSFTVVSFFNWSSRRSKLQEFKLWLSRKGMNRLLRIWATVGSVVVVMATVVAVVVAVLVVVLAVLGVVVVKVRLCMAVCVAAVFHFWADWVSC